MLSLDIGNYDKLYELVMGLSVITLLLEAVTDEEFVEYNIAEFDYALALARKVLYDEQRKTVLELMALISKEDFMRG